MSRSACRAGCPDRACVLSSPLLKRRQLTGTVLTLFLVALASVPALAGTFADRVQETVLPNGLKVLLVEEPKAPVVSIQTFYRVGSRNEVTNRTGLAHMLEHMMFKGTPNVGPKQFDLIITRNGGYDNAVTSPDYTKYDIDIAADRVELALRLEADRMSGLLLDEKEFLPERQVVIEERRLRIEDQPINFLSQTLMALAFQAHPYRNPPIGWPSDMPAWTREDMVQFYNTYYVPNNAFLVVAGKFNKAELLPKIEALFGKIPRKPDPPKVITVEPPQVGERRAFVKKDVELPVYFAVHHTPNLTHPDAFPLQVLAYVLGGGESARFYQKLGYQQQLASFAGADYNPLRIDPYVFGFSAGPLAGKTVEEIEPLLYAEVARLIKEPIPDRELQKAKNQIESEFVFAQDSVHSLAELVGRYEVVAGWKALDSFLAGVRKVTSADVQRVAQQYLVPENRTIAILVPTKSAPAAAAK
jgi:zinc protease